MATQRIQLFLVSLVVEQGFDGMLNARLDQGQGGAQAFEDAAALGALFTADTKPEQIEQKLHMYNDIRYKQAVTILFMSRVGNEFREQKMGELRRFVPDAKLPEDMWLFAWDSHPVKAAQRALVAAGM